MKKHDLSSQDVRAKILQLRDSLILNLEFLQQAIDEDLQFLKRYKERFGDLNYRPVIGRDIDQNPNYGERTELMIEPVASKYRATIKSLLDSVRLIEAEILPEDNPEGSSAASNNDAEALQSKRASLRAEFSAASGTSGKAVEPDNSTYEEDEEDNAQQAVPVQEQPKAKTPISKSVPERAQSTTPQTTEPKTQARPWRTKPQAVIVPKEKTVEPEPKIESKPTEQKSLTKEGPLSERGEQLRAQLMSLKGGGSKMAALVGKYGKKDRTDED